MVLVHRSLSSSITVLSVIEEFLTQLQRLNLAWFLILNSYDYKCSIRLYNKWYSFKVFQIIPEWSITVPWYKGCTFQLDSSNSKGSSGLSYGHLLVLIVYHLSFLLFNICLRSCPRYTINYCR